MGEAKRRQQATAKDEVGTILIEANRAPCFDWTGTKAEAIALQKRFLETMDLASPITAFSYAKRAVGYLMVFGMPNPGDPDRRPSAKSGDIWAADEIAIVRLAILWLALREHLPDTGKKVEDIFTGAGLVVVFEGDAEAISKEPTKFTMKVGILSARRPAIQ
jgi:hypothetical protein